MARDPEDEEHSQPQAQTQAQAQQPTSIAIPASGILYGKQFNCLLLIKDQLLNPQSMHLMILILIVYQMLKLKRLNVPHH